MLNYARASARRRLAAALWWVPLLAGCSQPDSSAVDRSVMAPAPSVTTPAGPDSARISPTSRSSALAGPGRSAAASFSTRGGTTSVTGHSPDSSPSVPAAPSSHVSASEPSSTGSATYLVECPGADPAVRPSSIMLSCGDGNESLTDVEWSSWGGASASATATYVVNLCEPSCAEGKPAEYPVHVLTNKLAQRAVGQLYTSITVTFDAQRPESASPSQDYSVGS